MTSGGSHGTATTIARGDHTHFGETWSGSATRGLGVTTTGSIGIIGEGADYGVQGVGSLGVYGEGTGYGVSGWSASRGVYGFGTDTGVYGSSNSYGVYGVGTNSGVRGDSSGYGLWGTSSLVGVYGSAPAGTYGVYGSGSVYYASGNFAATGTKSFRIDHPLDPANKHLNHSVIESSDVMNLYNGNVTLDEHGEATIDLPEWFEALNRDFRYQLTCIGAFAPVYVAEEISQNQFRIAGGKEGLKVSWQVTGIRHDKFADTHRIPVEEDKPAGEQGKYLYPELYWLPSSAGVGQVEAPQVAR